jgi:hypothetical protein
MTNPYEDTWETYVSAWRIPSVDEKRRILQQAVADSGEYRDPLAETKGHDQLIGYMVAFHEQAPGAYFTTTYFLAHHDRSVARWNMVDGEGNVLGDGITYGQYGGDGKLVAMTGFFEVPKSRS